MATVADAPKIAQVHVASWFETYRGLVPDDMLEALSFSRRTSAWERILRDPYENDNTTVYLKEVGSALAGFGACGEQRDGELRARGFDGEIGSIYVLQEFQGRGIGRALMNTLARDLGGRGFQGVALWVLDQNTPARRFYEHCYGELVGEKKDVRVEAELIEVAYGWRKLETLVQRTRARDPQ